MEKSVKKIFSNDTLGKFKRAFGYDVASIEDYTKMDSPEIIDALIESSYLLEKVSIQRDIKNKGVVKVLAGSVPLGEWSGCTITDSGDLEFKDVVIETKKLGFSIAFCNEDLVAKWTSLMLKTGAKAELMALPEEERVIAMFIALLRNRIQDVLILGDVLSPDSSLEHFDGIAKQITTSATAGTSEDAVTVTGTTLTTSNAFENFQKVARGFPAPALESNLNLAIWCNATDFNKLVDNLMADNNFHYSADIQGNGNNRSLVLPGTGIKVEVQRGLADDELYGVVYEFIAVGTDDDADMSRVDVDYLVESRKVRTEAMAYIGVGLVEKKNFVKFVTA